MIEVRLAIVDECGDIVAWCDKMSDEESQELVDTHPEWYYKCIDVGTDVTRPYYANEWL